MADDDARDARERGWRQLAQIDAAYENGSLDQDGWHQAVLAIVEPAYLSAATPTGGSGHSGSRQEWDDTRAIVIEAVERPGTFLDVGCANGLLMESVHRWGAARGTKVEPYGVEISRQLTDLARARYPHWGRRIWCANAAVWRPSRRFDYVRTATEYVPVNRRADYLDHLLTTALAPGGRLIVGKLNELRDEQHNADWARQAGFVIAGEIRRPSQHPDVEHAVFWIDSPRVND